MRTAALRIVFAVILFAGILSDVEAQEDLALKHFEQGVDYHLNGKNDEAIREFKKSVSYNKKSANTHFDESVMPCLWSFAFERIQSE